MLKIMNNKISAFLTIKTEQQANQWAAWSEEFDNVVYGCTEKEALCKLNENMVELFTDYQNDLEKLCLFLDKKVSIFTVFNENQKIVYQKHSSVKNEFIITFHDQ